MEAASNQKMNTWQQIVLVLIVIFVIGGCFQSCVMKNDTRDIQEFVSPATTLEVDVRTWNTGPFWANRHARHYYVRTSDGRTLWFRFGWSMDVEQEIDGKYVKLK